MGKMKTAFVSEPEENKEKHKDQHKKEEKIHISGLKGGQRIKAIDAEPVLSAEEEEKAEAKRKAPRIRGKKWTEQKTTVDREKFYAPEKAIALAQKTSYSKFDGTMELHIIVKKVGATANVTLPFSAGKTKKVEIASEETLKNLAAGKIDFDILLSTPEMMPKLVVFARILGPKGLMPNPKNGTIISSTAKAKEFSGNRITLKTEKDAPLIHTTFGKVSQKSEELLANLEAVFKVLGGAKQIVKAYTKATMGPAIKIKVS
jgi:large subunit ribosomal protein L1